VRLRVLNLVAYLFASRIPGGSRAAAFEPIRIIQENPMKLLVALMVAVFAMSALVGCKGEAAVDTDGHAASNIPAVR
jgi:hypothetical protein